jgi:hypothetical protein
MIKMMFLFRLALGKGVERAAPISSSSRFALRSFAEILETMT